MAAREKRKASPDRKRVDGVSAEAVKSTILSSRRTGQMLIVVVLGILIYANSFGVPFLFDDNHSIVNNAAIKEFRHLFDSTNPYKNRLVAQLTLAVNYKLHGLDVAGYHVFNLFIHLTNALLVYWLMILTLRTPYASLHHQALKAFPLYRWLPLLAALLFVSHPIQTQAVTYIVQRSASLATLFCLLALVMYVKARESDSATRGRYLRYALSVSAAIVAMWTKEIAFTLPVMALLYEFLFFRGDIKKRVLFLLPLLATMFIIPLSLALGLGAMKGAEGIDEITKLAGSTDIPRWDYLNTQFRVIVTYLRLLVFPVAQNLDYDYPVYRTFFTPPVYLSFLFLAGIFGWGIYLLYRSSKSDRAVAFWYRLTAFGIFWFFVTLSVESSIIPILDVIYEHRLYLPSVGFMLAVAAAAAAIEARLAGRGRTATKGVAAVMVLAVVSLSVAAHARNMVWRDEVTFWEDVARKSPSKVRVHSGLGLIYQKRGRFDDAVRKYREVIAIQPGYVHAHHNLGVTYQQQGRLDDAIREYRTAIGLKPDYADTHDNLGLAYQQQGRLDDAVKAYQTAIRLEPDYWPTHNNLASAYHEQGRLDDAIREYQTAIRLGADSAAIHYNLAVAYHQQGRLDDAVREYRTAIRIKPDYADAYNDLGIVYQKQGRLTDAVRELQTAIRLEPNHAAARSNLNDLRKAMQTGR